MTLNEIYNAADGLAPFALSLEFIEKFGQYDNSGIALDCGGEIGGVLFSLDLSVAAAEEAVKQGCNCIFTHHPAIWQGIKRLDGSTPALFACVKARISVLSAHLNLDAAPEGIDELLMRALGGKEPLAVMERLTGGGYGRVYDVAPVSMAEFVAHAGRELGTARILSYGEKRVKRVASFCGAGFDERAISFALEHGADTVVSSDPKHHLLAEAAERGLNVAILTHYAAEAYGFAHFCNRMRKSLSVPCVFFADERLK